MVDNNIFSVKHNFVLYTVNDGIYLLDRLAKVGK